MWYIDFDPSGTYLVSCSEDKTWIVWAIAETSYKKLCQVKNTHYRAIYSISWSPSTTSSNPNGAVNRIATVGSDNQLMVHELDANQLQ